MLELECLSLFFYFFGNSLYYCEYKLAKFQSGWFFVWRWFLQDLFSLKDLASSPSVFIAACFLFCHFILVVQVRGRIGVFVVLDKTTSGVELYCFCVHSLAISVSDCQLSLYDTVILISSSLEDISVKIWWSSAFWEFSGGSSFSTAKITLQGDSEEGDTKLKGKEIIGEVICCEQIHVSHLTQGSRSN